jgi:hypothetical protein
MLSEEIMASRREARDGSRITPANYRFNMLGQDTLTGVIDKQKAAELLMRPVTRVTLLKRATLAAISGELLFEASLAYHGQATLSRWKTLNSRTIVRVLIGMSARANFI